MLPRGNLLTNVAARGSVAARWPLAQKRAETEDKKNKKARFHSGDRASAREMGGVCLHVCPTRVFAGIAKTVQARLGAEALEPDSVRDLPRGHRGGRARKRHLARNADLIRC